MLFCRDFFSRCCAVWRESIAVSANCLRGNSNGFTFTIIETHIELRMHERKSKRERDSV